VKKMQLKKLDFDFEVKSVEDDGLFTGYGSVFGVKDSYDEIVERGAFADSLQAHKSKGTMPALLWQHRAGEPIGVWPEMAEDDIGLKMQGRLALKTARGLEAYELLKMKAISGLSIGFMTREDSYDKLTGIRTLKKVDLWEVSLVTFPANDSSRVQGVKSIELITSIRECELHLRDACGMSRTEARAFISRVKNLGQRDADGDDLENLIAAIEMRGKALL
jgi:HK97 family phage prohead protease